MFAHVAYLHGVRLVNQDWNPMWNAAQYLKYSDERSRPFNDLLSQVRVESPRQIADLGCGPGNLTRTLLDRWSDAQVIGIDRSNEMLAKAASLTNLGKLEFAQADIAKWSATTPLVDLPTFCGRSENRVP